MSGNIILAKPSDLENQQAEINHRASAARSEFGQVNTELLALSSQFRGAAADAFTEKMDSWKESAEGLVKGLEGMAEFLGSAAEAFGGVDSGLAAGLTGQAATSVCGLVAAEVEELRTMAKTLGRLSETIDGDARDLLSHLGLSQPELGGPRTCEAIQSFQSSWSDARKKLVDNSNVARSFLDSAATAYEDLDRQLREALTGAPPSGTGGRRAGIS